MIVCDASFIGLATVLPAAVPRRRGSGLVALVKPQFEAGRSTWARAASFATPPSTGGSARASPVGWAEPGWRVLGIVESPILGAEGNREFLLCAAAAPSRARRCCSGGAPSKRSARG